MWLITKHSLSNRITYYAFISTIRIKFQCAARYKTPIIFSKILNFMNSKSGKKGATTIFVLGLYHGIARNALGFSNMRGSQLLTTTLLKMIQLTY